MTSKIKFTGILLLLVVLMTVSCDKKTTFEPITLIYDADGAVFDNQSKLISVPLFGKSLPILIKGGDGNFSITNNSEFFRYTLDGERLIIYAIVPGTGSIVIKDNSNNSYILQVTVLNNEVPSVKVSSYSIVRGVNMDVLRKTTLERQIAADAPTGVWKFGSDAIQIGVPFVARQYLTDAENSAYKEYTAVLLEKRPQKIPPVPVACCFTMKSDTEEFLLYISGPFQLDNGKTIRGYSFVREVTSRYTAEYPEITQAFEVQSYSNQNN